MYLKSLEIQGFKSFANRVEFEFPSGIAMIIGPNGSGKSNVVDAIRWVLGEQSVKSLRGGKQEDIIFAGSDKRKAVGMGQVSITLDNTKGIFPVEYNEITVTRRVYRSGESEFLINKTPCRLKDIHELFMDTGLGKEAYSIISQGKVEEIILAKPEERRALIEEAAGITKYRVRKQEAGKKLAETEQSLIRVEDIILELEGQLEPLRLQAGTAEQYLNFSSQLRGLEVGLLTHQINDYRTKLDNCRGSLTEIKQQIIERETNVSLCEARSAERRLELQQKNEALYQTQQAVFEVATSIERQESNLNLSEEKKTTLEQKIEALTKEIEAAKVRLSLLQEEEKEEQARYNDVIENIGAEQAYLSAEEQRLNDMAQQFQSIKREEEEAKGELIEILNKIAQSKNNASKKEFEEDALRRRLVQINQEQDKLSVELEQVNSEINQEKNKSTELAGSIEKFQKEVVEQEKRRLQEEESLSVLRRELQVTYDHSNRLKTRLKTLKELKEDFEGYQKGVKEILKYSKSNASLKGIRGVVAEVVQVPKELEVAIEVALGGALQHVITETDEVAKKAIEFLKKSNNGRATFLPLNTVKPYGLKEQDKTALKLKGVLGLASELISFPKDFTPVIEYLLGRILVVNNVEEALGVARKIGHKLKIVTLEGEVLNPGGSMTGGSLNRKDSGLLRRSREIEELEVAVQETDKKLASIALREDEIKKVIAELSVKIAAAKEQEQNSKFELASLEKDLARLKQEKVKLEGNLQSLIYDIEENQLSLANLTTELKELGQTLEAYGRQEDQLRKKIAANQNRLEAEESIKIEVVNKVTEVKVKLAALEQQKSNAFINLRRQQRLVEELQGTLSVKEEELIGTFEQQITLRGKTEEFREEMKNLFSLKEKREQELAAGRDIITELTLLAEQNEAKSKSLAKEVQALQQQEKESEIKEARFEAELETCFRRLNSDLELTFEEALQEGTEITDRREANRLVKDLKNTIAELGSVNIAAIEDYSKVKERYDFLSKQFKDLSEAKDSLYKVIKEMEAIMTKKFKEAFAAIDENFRAIFSELFAGGKAYLQLTDEEAVLETGVEIIAQPPGKKPQHLNLLSGGEKALTAIGLLFALLKVKPSPFCVLDEIEASLDEANIDRFAEFLKEFAKHSQFVVISHRKGTMAAADVLYGITIDDFGVSKMVSLALHS